jgi:hypothetical protein
MGIVTWMNLKAEFATKIDKIYFAPIDDLAYARNSSTGYCREGSARKSSF